MNVKCPACGKPSTLDKSNSYRPFCCERCSTNDLGAWADEKYAVPVEETSTVNKKSDEDARLEDELSTERRLH